MALDRDLNVALVRALRAAGRTLPTGWEMLSATGVRGLRTLHEAGGFRRFDLTELNPAAAELLVANAAAYASEGARALRRDARSGAPAGPYDYVDLDPYGTPVPHLGVAISATAPGGVLGVTATDQRVLAGAERGVAELRYGGRPVRGRLAGEGGLRLLLATVVRAADAAGRSVVPILSYVGDHHVRAYLALDAGPPGTPLPHVREVVPATWSGPPLGEGGPFGPLWLGPLHDPEVVRHLAVDPQAEHPEELARWILRLQQEATVDVPFYYESNSLAHHLHLSAPPSTAALLEGLRSLGRRAAPGAARPGSFRTDATFSEVAGIARELAQSQNERVRA